MASTIFVTGATGQTGGNVCEQLIERGDQVRALVRNPDEATALAGIGVELVKGDIRDADDVLRAAKGAEAAIHCAALLGGASQDLEDFKAVNVVGTANVLDAGKAHGMRRVVALSTATFLNLGTGARLRRGARSRQPAERPLHGHQARRLSGSAPARRRGRRRADLPPRRDLRSRPGRRTRLAPHQLQPGAAGRHARKDQALSRFSGDLGGRSGCRDRARSPRWITASPVSATCWSASPKDSFSTAGGINRACEVAGIDHHVEDLDYRTDPEALTAEFGPTLMAIAEAAAKSVRKPRTDDNLTTRRLGYRPMSFDDGLRLLISWLREIGRL